MFVNTRVRDRIKKQKSEINCQIRFELCIYYYRNDYIIMFQNNHIYYVSCKQLIRNTCLIYYMLAYIMYKICPSLSVKIICPSIGIRSNYYDSCVGILHVRISIIKISKQVYLDMFQIVQVFEHYISYSDLVSKIYISKL